MNIGRVIKKYGILREMTQEELAGKLAVTPQALPRLLSSHFHRND